jgi:hypothetical protein
MSNYTLHTKGDRRTIWIVLAKGEHAVTGGRILSLPCRSRVKQTQELRETPRGTAWVGVQLDLGSITPAPRWFTRAWRWLRRSPRIPTAQVVNRTTAKETP